MHLLDPSFPEIIRPIGYMPDTEYQARAIRIYLTLVRSEKDRVNLPFTIARYLALAWESALFMGEY